MSAPFIGIRGLSKSYMRGERALPVLKNINLDIAAGEFLALMGPSGSGKSTLLNLIAGIDRADDGSIAIEGVDITTLGEASLTAWRSDHVGFIFQFYNLIPSLTALENVAVVTEIASKPMKPEDALSIVGLAERLNHFPSQLSGGEQQRIAIARAISKNPSVLLCDEPTGALDSATGVVVLEALERVNRELGTTTAIITHNADIAGMADRVVHLSNGHISEITRNAVKKPPREIHW